MMKSRMIAAASALVALALAGCGTSGPSVSATANPQVASYTITPYRAGVVTVDFGTDTTYGRSTSPQHTAVGPLSILVAGMKANTTYHMRARVDYDNGDTFEDDDHTFTTGAVPAGIVPKFEVTTNSALTPQPGIELVDVLQGATPSIPYATDLEGNVIWTYTFPDHQAGSTLYPIKLLPNGHFMFLIGPISNQPVLTGPISPQTLNAIREIDLAGNTIRQLTMADLNARLAAANYNLTLQVFSHDFVPLANGHILVIANTLKAFTNLVGIPGTTNVLGDVVIDLDPNFNPVWVWNEFDHLDVNRHPMMFPDWTHSNALAYSQDDGNFLISIRHQNWVVKVDYRDGTGTGNIIWKLGEAGDFKLVGAVDPTDWFYAQHDVNFVSPNTTGSFKIALMDNGDDRIFAPGVACNSPGAPACLHSSIPIMQVDENAKTASFLFHYIVPASLYSSFAGSTRVLDNSNIEYNLAAAGADAYTNEVTPTDTPQTVWQMHIVGSNTYRSFRIPSLYPGVQW